MSRSHFLIAAKAALLPAALLLIALPVRAQTSETPWHITGTLSEACSCSVPCSCNFHEAPSPHPFCWAFVGMTIQKGNYGDVSLNGLRLGGANGDKGFVFYTDPRATPEQKKALDAIIRTTWLKALKANGITDPKKAPPEMALLAIQPGNIEHTYGNGKNHVLIENMGRFDGSYILGMDDKPVEVSNNYSFNIQHNIKAKTSVMRYRDRYGNKFDLKDTNSNQGEFDWSDSTPVYFR